MRKLYKFHGGVHPPGHKEQSLARPIVKAPLPSRLVIPFHQHVGNIAKTLVKEGDYVLKGQLIGMPQDGVSSAVHAPTSGIIEKIGMEVVAHPSGLPDLCATLIPDGRDEWILHEGVHYRGIDAADIRLKLRLAGVVGLGGAVFPSDLKLRSGKHKVNTLIINGAECEPYITCDDMLMRSRAQEIIRGAEILAEVLDVSEILVGIEDNKPEAIKAMQQAAHGRSRIEVIAVPTIYPGGGAKQLIKVLTGIEIPSGIRSTEKGVQCFNVATALSVYRALQYGEPLLSRVVTVSGNVKHAGNYEVLFGTPVDELVKLAQPLPDTNRYIMGGPMMGIQLPNVNVSVVKATNCIIAASDKLFPPPQPALPCIRCTRCVEVCPAELQPQDLYWFSKAREFGKAQEYHLFDCIECGACSYVCPSQIPLVQYYRYAKSEIWARESEKNAAERARDRFEFREARIEREKQEKAEKLAAKERAAREKIAAQASAEASTPLDENQQKIQAAIELAKQQAANAKPANVENLTPQQQAEIAETEARRAHIRELAQSHVEHNKEKS